MTTTNRLSLNKKYNDLIKIILANDRKVIAPIGGLSVLVIPEIALVINSEEEQFSNIRKVNYENPLSQHLMSIVDNSEELTHHVKNNSNTALSSYERAVILLASNYVIFRDTKIVKLLFGAIDLLYGKKYFTEIEFSMLQGDRDEYFLVIKTPLLAIAILPILAIKFVEN